MKKHPYFPRGRQTEREGTLTALRPAAEQLLRHHSEEDNDFSDGETSMLAE